MNKAIKILILTAGAAAFAGTGYAAWNIAVTGDTLVEKTPTIDVSGNVSLNAASVQVVDTDNTIKFAPNDDSDMSLVYTVSPSEAEWYTKVAELDTTQEVNLKIDVAVSPTACTYLNVPEATQTLAPSVWLADSNGYEVELVFSWKMAGGPLAYAEDTYPTAEARKDYLDGISATLVGMSIDITFDLVAVPNP